MPRKPDPNPATAGEVRYSLPEMIEDLKRERAAPIFAMEIVDQAEIRNLFKGKKPARGRGK